MNKCLEGLLSGMRFPQEWGTGGGDKPLIPASVPRGIMGGCEGDSKRLILLSITQVHPLAGIPTGQGRAKRRAFTLDRLESVATCAR
ncbi:MAG: hypothetical protein IJ719_09905 [Clostridia bacterium]|nr:hypothetical protein [Clostridia bacterium]